jgi:hypothetical protein
MKMKDLSTFNEKDNLRLERERKPGPAPICESLRAWATTCYQFVSSNGSASHGFLLVSHFYNSEEYTEFGGLAKYGKW